MTITFDWAAVEPILKNPSLKQPAEETMKNLVDAKPEKLKRCHEGPLVVSFVDSNEAETLLKGSITCQCSKAIALFSLGTRTGNIRIQFTS
jgi:hypothetical protein